MTKLLSLAIAGAVLQLATACKDPPTSSSSASDTVAKLTALRDRMCACKDVVCAREVAEEMTAWSRTPRGKLRPEEQKRAAELGVATGECMKRVSGVARAPGSGASVAGPAPAPGAEVGTTADAGVGSAEGRGGDGATGPAIAGLPQECLDYKAAIDKLATCDKITQQARDTLVKAYVDTAPAWANLPESAQASTKASCKAGAQSVLAVARQHCGW